MNRVHDSIAKPTVKTRNGWNSKRPKTTRGQKLKGNYYSAATPVQVSWIER